MELNKYQELAMTTAAKHNSVEETMAITALGLTGEAGEVADMIKKHLGHNHPLDHEVLVKELGDVLWYIAVLSSAIGCDLEVIAQRNIDKLRARYPKGFSVERSLHREDRNGQ